MAQVWFVKWSEKRTIRERPLGSVVFKTNFHNMIFSLELTEKILVEFMNLRQGGMSVKKYSFKFTQLSKFSPIFVDNSRAIINKFLMGVSSLVDKECCRKMLHHDIDITRRNAYAKQIEEFNLRKMNKNGKRARSD